MGFFGADNYARLAHSVLPVVLQDTTADRSLPYDRTAFEQSVRGILCNRLLRPAARPEAPTAPTRRQLMQRIGANFLTAEDKKNLIWFISFASRKHFEGYAARASGHATPSQAASQDSGPVKQLVAHYDSVNAALRRSLTIKPTMLQTRSTVFKRGKAFEITGSLGSLPPLPFDPDTDEEPTARFEVEDNFDLGVGADSQFGNGGKRGTCETASSTSWEDGRSAKDLNGGILDVPETTSSTPGEDGRRAVDTNFVDDDGADANSDASDPNKDERKNKDKDKDKESDEVLPVPSQGEACSEVLPVPLPPTPHDPAFSPFDGEAPSSNNDGAAALGEIAPSVDESVVTDEARSVEGQPAAEVGNDGEIEGLLDPVDALSAPSAEVHLNTADADDEDDKAD